MKSPQELGETLRVLGEKLSKLWGSAMVQAQARPRAAAALLLLAPPALAVSWKGVTDTGQPAQEDAPQRGDVAAGDLYLLAQVDALREELAAQSREVAKLQLALDRVETEHVAAVPSSLETGAFRAEPTEAEYLQRRPHLIDPEPAAMGSLRVARGDERSHSKQTLLIGDSDSNGASLERTERPDPPSLPDPVPGGPKPPHGAPEIDPNLATAGLLLLAGGALALTGRRRTARE